MAVSVVSARAAGTRRAENKFNARLGPESWVRAALRTLHKEGIDQVRVERLAKELGVTKGSFYWHFKDRQKLLDAVLEYWFRTMTETVFEVARRFRGEPMARMYAVLEDITRHDRAGYDLAVRAWARFDRKAAAAVRDIDNQRLEFLRQLFADVGFDAREAELRARLMYYFIIGEAMAFNRQRKAERLETIQRKVDILAARTP